MTPKQVLSLAIVADILDYVLPFLLLPIIGDVGDLAVIIISGGKLLVPGLIEFIPGADLLPCYTAGALLHMAKTKAIG